MTYTYIGGGDWIPGVPARDLTEDEYKQHRDVIDANTKAMGRALYVADASVIDVEDDDMTGEEPAEE